MNFINDSALYIAKASKGNPVISTLTVMMFYLMFSVLEAGVEQLIFGKSFGHWLDPIFGLAFIAYAALSVVACAVHNSN